MEGMSCWDETARPNKTVPDYSSCTDIEDRAEVVDVDCIQWREEQEKLEDEG